MKVDLGVCVWSSGSGVEEIDGVKEGGVSWGLEAEETLYRDEGENLSLEGDVSLSLEPLLGAGILTTL